MTQSKNYKIRKGLNRHFAKDYIQIANKHMKKMIDHPLRHSSAQSTLEAHWPIGAGLAGSTFTMGDPLQLSEAKGCKP